MDAIDAIRDRRAVRDYKEAPLEESTVETLIEAAVQAPSAMNLQPWAFAVTLDRNQIARLSERAKNWVMNHVEDLALSDSAQAILHQPGFTLFHGAPTLVIVFATSGSEQASEDCCLAAENLMLRARELSIGSCWIGFARPWLNLPAIKKEFGVPEHYRVVAPIVLGYPESWPSSHGRRPAEIHWINPSSELEPQK